LWVKETPKDTQEYDLGLCKFVGYFRVFPFSYLRRCKGPAVLKRDQQKMHRKSLYIFQTHENARGPQVSAPFVVVKQYHITGNTVVNSCLKIRHNDDRDFSPKMTFIRTLKIFREFGMCNTSLGTNWTPRQKRVQLERLGGWKLAVWIQQKGKKKACPYYPLAIPSVIFPSPRLLGGDSPPRSWARGGDTYCWHAAAPTLFVFVLTAELGKDLCNADKIWCILPVKWLISNDKFDIETFI